MTTVRLKLERPVHGGYCLGFSGGSTFFVRDGLPGETVVAKESRRRGNTCFARTVEVVEPSVHRQPPVWQQGVDFQIDAVDLGHVDFTYQSIWKSLVLRDCLSRLGGPEVLEAAQAQGPLRVENLAEDSVEKGLGTRVRADFRIGEQSKLAMYRSGTQSLAEVSSFPLANLSLEDAGVFNHPSRWTSLWKPGDKVRFACSDTDFRIAVNNRVFDFAGEPAPAQLDHFLPGGQRVRVRVQDFWQPHQYAAATLSTALGNLVQKWSLESVVELYSGSGLFSLGLAQQVGEYGHLSCYEGNAHAVRNARHNLKANGLDRQSRVAVADITHTTFAKLAAKHPRVDLVVLDPPRTGAGVKLMSEIVSLRPRHLLYLACDPASLSRDLAVCVNSGYRIDSLQAWNLFPHTHHFETLVCLSI